MADSTRDKSPWEETLDSFIRYVALNPKEFLLYGNEQNLIASLFSVSYLVLSMEIDRSQGSRGNQESKKIMKQVRKLKNNNKNLKNNRKFIGNVKIVIQGSLKTENIMKGRNFRDQFCPVVIILIDFGGNSTTAGKS